MARIRTIKPELLTDEKTSGLSDKAWRLFVSCILMADDYGNFRATDSFLHSQAFFNTGTTREEVANVRGELAGLSLLEFYEVKGQTYGHVAGWSKHQRVDKPGKPICPGKIEDSRKPRETPGKVPVVPAPDLEEDLEEEKEGKVVSRVATTQPTTVRGLLLRLKIAVEREQPQAGMWTAGPWGNSAADKFLTGFIDDPPGAEIQKRIDLFASDKAMAPWSVEKFTAKYMEIGQPKAPPPRQYGAPQIMLPTLGKLDD